MKSLFLSSLTILLFVVFFGESWAVESEYSCSFKNPCQHMREGGLNFCIYGAYMKKSSNETIEIYLQKGGPNWQLYSLSQYGQGEFENVDDRILISIDDLDTWMTLGKDHHLASFYQSYFIFEEDFSFDGSCFGITPSLFLN